jgi:hypothetical protein
LLDRLELVIDIAKLILYPASLCGQLFTCSVGAAIYFAM